MRPTGACPANLTGLHVWRPGPRGSYPRCRCGREQPQPDPTGRRVPHAVVNCPCQGDEGNCAYWRAQSDAKRQRERIGWAERRYRESVGSYVEALYAMERERAALESERAEHARLRSAPTQPSKRKRRHRATGDGAVTPAKEVPE